MTDAAGRVVYTDVSVVKIAAGSAIVEQPKDVTVEAGNKAEFSVLPSGEGLTYQWQYQKPGKMTWVNSGSSGNKTARVKVTGTTGTNGMKFRCIVMDGDGNITISNYATLTVMLQ